MNLNNFELELCSGNKDSKILVQITNKSSNKLKVLEV